MSSLNQATPICELCHEHTGLCPTNSVIVLNGQWMPTHDVGMVFVLEPETSISVVQLPNGQLALTLGEKADNPVLSAHQDCMERLISEELYDGCQSDYCMGCPNCDEEMDVRGCYG